MGGGASYSSSSRKVRAAAAGYDQAAINTGHVFTQQKEGKAHESMMSQSIELRECRDSENHPSSLPVILELDVTGSMLGVPKYLVTQGLPHIMDKLLALGRDPALLFCAVGDQYSDDQPLQIGQFESGDAELDLWLTRTWLEGNGGGNGGESYLLGWWFALNRVQTDQWDKRKEKGVFISIGDDHNHLRLEKKAIAMNFGLPENAVEEAHASALLEALKEKYHVFHIHYGADAHTAAGWKKTLGAENVRVIYKQEEIADTIVSLVAGVSKVAPPADIAVAQIASGTTGDDYTPTTML